MNKAAIFPLFYFPPIEYFHHFILHKDNLLLELEEHFPKQTFRNRTTIHSPQGKLDLIVPVVKGSKMQTKIKDVKISYDFNWQRLHLSSIQTAYRNSAYYEFYEDDLLALFEKKHQFLYELNLEILQMLMRFLKVKTEIKFTDAYDSDIAAELDFREKIHPKRSSNFKQKPYFQVFEDRNGFLSGLSTIDLLFNQGPQSLMYL